VKWDQYVFHCSIESRPFQKVYVDIVGPLVPGEWEGLTVTHIITMMDGFTKWTEATPVADTTAATVARVLVEQWITRYGVPEQIHSDRGAQFTSEVYTEMLRLLGIQGTVTPPIIPGQIR
jgi:transposase InsO family protein